MDKPRRREREKANGDKVNEQMPTFKHMRRSKIRGRLRRDSQTADRENRDKNKAASDRSWRRDREEREEVAKREFREGA